MQKEQSNFPSTKAIPGTSTTTAHKCNPSLDNPLCLQCLFGHFMEIREMYEKFNSILEDEMVLFVKTLNKLVKSSANNMSVKGEK